MTPEEHAQIWGYTFLHRNEMNEEIRNVMLRMRKSLFNFHSQSGRTCKCDDYEDRLPIEKCTEEARCYCLKSGSECSLYPRHCNGDCPNQPIQQMYADGVNTGKVKVVYEGADMGMGLMAREDFEAGELIGEYCGVVKYFDRDEVGAYYLTQIGSKVNKKKIKEELVIDAGEKGNLTRFINHNCSPNAEMKEKKIDAELRVGLYASRRILAGEMITFDYGGEYFKFSGIICKCGAPNCRYGEGSSSSGSAESSKKGSSKRKAPGSPKPGCSKDSR